MIEGEVGGLLGTQQTDSDATTAQVHTAKKSSQQNCNIEEVSWGVRKPSYIQDWTAATILELQ